MRGGFLQGNARQLTDWTGRSCETLLRSVNSCWYALTINSRLRPRQRKTNKQTKKNKTVFGKHRINFLGTVKLGQFVRIKMGSWKNHVRGQLQHRDQREKVPYAGVFTSCKINVFCFATMMHLLWLTPRASDKSVFFQCLSWKSVLKFANKF